MYLIKVRTTPTSDLFTTYDCANTEAEANRLRQIYIDAKTISAENSYIEKEPVENNTGVCLADIERMFYYGCKDIDQKYVDVHNAYVEYQVEQKRKQQAEARAELEKAMAERRARFGL